MKTTEKIQAIYEAFGQGNVPFILENVADNFTWTDPSDPAIVPHSGTYVGRDGFLTFFQRLGGNTTTTAWEVSGYVSEGNKVVATGKHGVIVNATGKSHLNDWAMEWTFEGDKLVAGRSYYDTAGLEQAFK
ncbi:MAG: nuclear transport factor 2 family protein [Spirosomataceae bacterium]